MKCNGIQRYEINNKLTHILFTNLNSKCDIIQQIKEEKHYQIMSIRNGQILMLKH